MHVVMSDLLRAESEKPGSPWAEEIKQKMSTGALVSKEVSTAVLRRFVDELPRSDGKRYFLDGFPRNLEQAMAFDKEVCLQNRMCAYQLTFSVRWGEPKEQYLSHAPYMCWTRDVRSGQDTTTRRRLLRADTKAI